MAWGEGGRIGGYVSGLVGGGCVGRRFWWVGRYVGSGWAGGLVGR